MIAVAASSLDARGLFLDMKGYETVLGERSIHVSFVDARVAQAYSISKRGIADHADFSPLVREALSLARYVHDPLAEASRLCDNDVILSLQMHTMQGLVCSARASLLSVLT